MCIRDRSKDDYDMLNFLKSGGYRTVIALTKIDKLNKTERAQRLEAVSYTHLPEQAEENTTPETAPAEDTKKAEKKASKSSKKDRIAELEKELEKARHSP